MNAEEDCILHLQFALGMPSHEVRNMMARWYMLLFLWAHLRCSHG